MRRWTGVLFLVGLVACGDGGGGGPDARPAPDAMGVIDAAGLDAPPPDAIPAVCHHLYLNFDGGTLHPGNESAANNTSSVITQTSVLSPYSAATAVKVAFAAQVSDALAPFGVDVTTTRPQSGLYIMIMVGGSGPQIGQPQNAVALVPAVSDCSTGFLNAIGFVFEGAVPDVEMANLAIAGFGALRGVPMSTDPQDCMCFAAGTCGTATTACTIGGAGTPRDPEIGSCGSGATFDEAAAFTSALTCP